jgi:hypothetical protein
VRRAAALAALTLALAGCPGQPQTDVRPGSFCSPRGAEGHTADGTVLRCTTAPDDPRDRWRR